MFMGAPLPRWQGALIVANNALSSPFPSSVHVENWKADRCQEPFIVEVAKVDNEVVDISLESATARRILQSVCLSSRKAVGKT